jgi:hypothetical protein
MKKIALCLLTFAAVSSAFADDYVSGYVRRDGTYVQPHFRSEANNFRFDNYSSRGNSNPYTGERGYERNEYSATPSYRTYRPSGSCSGYRSRYDD